MTDYTVERLAVTASDGRSLDVLVSGPTDGLPVVLHNGLPAGLAPLPAQIDPSGPGVRTVLYARPGYNASTPQPGRSVADSAGDTAAILDTLHAERFVTVGLSAGGPHALACAALLPDRCLATAVVAGPAPWPSVWPEDALPLTRQGPDAMTPALEEQRAQTMTVTAEDVREMFESPPDRAALAGDLAEWVALVNREAYAAGIAGVRDDNLACYHDWGFDLAKARRVSLWQGERDVIVDPAHAHWLAGHIPGAELHMLPEEGHFSICLHLPEIIDDLLARIGE